MVSSLKTRLRDRRLLFILAAVTLAIALVGVRVYYYREVPNTDEVRNPRFIMGNRAVTIHTVLLLEGQPANSAHLGDSFRFHMSIDPVANVSSEEAATLGESINYGSLKPMIAISDCGGNPNPPPAGTAIFEVPTTTPTDDNLYSLQWDWSISCNSTGVKQIEAWMTEPNEKWDCDYRSFTNFNVAEPVEQRIIPIITACSALIAALAGLRGLSLGSKSGEKI